MFLFILFGLFCCVLILLNRQGRIYLLLFLLNYSLLLLFNLYVLNSTLNIKNIFLFLFLVLGSVLFVNVLKRISGIRKSVEQFSLVRDFHNSFSVLQRNLKMFSGYKNISLRDKIGRFFALSLTEYLKKGE